MKKKLKEFTDYLYNQKGKKYTITHDGLKQFSELPKASQELLLKMLTCIKHQCDMNAFIITVDISKLGFNNATYFYRVRKPLIDRGFICCENKQFIINPYMINYYSRRQLEYVYKLFGINQEITFVWK